MYFSFSNSLIIHDKNTKELTTVKKVLISCLNLHRFGQFYSFVFSAFNNQLEKLYQTLERVFHQVFKHLEVVKKKLICTSFFNPLLGVGISDETLFLVFVIIITSQTAEASKELLKELTTKNLHLEAYSRRENIRFMNIKE